MYFTVTSHNYKNRSILTLSFFAVFFYNSFHEFSSAKELIILHNNNIFSRFEQIDTETGYCVPKKQCIGGFARMSTVIKQFREYNKVPNAPAVIYLFAGGLFTGSIWFSIHKSDIAIEMMNLLAPEAMSLGYPEFEAGTWELGKFVEGVKFPIVCANIDVIEEIQLKKVVKSTIAEVKGIKIGIVGHIVERAPDFAIIGDNIKFGNELKAVESEANALRTKGANIIIALGYSDWVVHEDIAKKIRNVDVVIGSMKNNLFINGKAPAGVVKEGDYPALIARNDTNNKKNDKEVKPAVATYGFTKYLGCLNLTLTSDNKISKATGQPIYMSHSIQQDPNVIEALNKYRKEIDAARLETVGITKVQLDGGKECHLQECNFGNLMADAYVAYAARKYSGTYWTDTPAAFIHSGMIVRGLYLKMNSNVSRGHIMDSIPVESEATAFDIQGKYLLEALEVSVKIVPGNEGAEFLQFSGMYVVFDFARPIGKRVVSAKIRCGSCPVPHYKKILRNETYRIMTPRSLASGVLGYGVLKRKLQGIQTSSLASTDILIEHIKRQRLLRPTEGDRIKILHREAVAADKFLEKITLLGTVYIISTYFVDY